LLEVKDRFTHVEITLFNSQRLLSLLEEVIFYVCDLGADLAKLLLKVFDIGLELIYTRKGL